MTLSPCPCMSLQKGSMALAIFDAVISMMNLGLMILAFIGYINYTDKDLTESERRVGLVVCIVLMVLCVLQILLAFRLYIGARNRDYRNCRIWLIITIIVTIINLINFIVNFTASDLNGNSFGGTLFVILYKVYEMCVVYYFLKELKLEVQGLGNGYTITAYPQPQPIFVNSNQPIYTTSQSQEVYPMQQYVSYPTTLTNHSYPAPVHHVTTTRIS